MDWQLVLPFVLFLIIGVHVFAQLLSKGVINLFEHALLSISLAVGLVLSWQVVEKIRIELTITRVLSGNAGQD